MGRKRQYDSMIKTASEEFYRDGDSFYAIASLRRAIQINPARSKAYKLLARIHLHHCTEGFPGELEKAIESLQKVTEIKPKDRWARNRLGECRR